MIDTFLMLPLFASFFITLFLMPFWIRKAKEIGLLWSDMNKLNSKKVSGSGGIIVILGFVIGVLIYVAYRTFFLSATNSFLLEVFALLTVILLLAGIGFVDDLLGWRRGGLSIRSRLVLVAVASIPLLAINAGKSSISLPFIGIIELGLFYPLVLIPIGVAGATTTYNFLAGFNGLESGQGIILLGSLAVVSFFTGNSWLSIVSFCMIASLLAFSLFNFYPAKVFPGDSLTYGVGGLIAVMAILGNFEKVALFFFVPYVLETILKSRGKLKKHSFGRPLPNGSIDLPYEKIYGLEHAAIFILQKFGIKSSEKAVVFLLWGFQICVIVLGFILFREGIFNAVQ